MPALAYAVAMIVVKKMYEELTWIHTLVFNGIGPVIGLMIYFLFNPSALKSYEFIEVVGLTLVGTFELLFNICLVFCFMYVTPS